MLLTNEEMLYLTVTVERGSQRFCCVSKEASIYHPWLNQKYSR
jgi:hypothetical protein